MKFLITGASGFIGKLLTSHLAGQEYQVIAVTRNAAAKFPAAVTHVTGDISKSPQVLEPYLTSDVFVIHAAAHTHLIPNSKEADYQAGNIDTTRHLLTAMKTGGNAGMLFLSTVSVYGDVTSDVLTVDAAPSNPNGYGLAKLAAENLILERADDVSSTIIRLPGVVGPGNFNPWIGRVAEKALRNEPIDIYNGQSLFNNITDTVEIADLAVHLSQKPDKGTGEIYNLAAGEPIKISAVIDELLECLGAKSPVRDTSTGQSSFYIDVDPLQKQLGFRPRSVREIVRNFGKNCRL